MNEQEKLAIKKRLNTSYAFSIREEMFSDISHLLTDLDERDKQIQIRDQKVDEVNRELDSANGKCFELVQRALHAEELLLGAGKEIERLKLELLAQKPLYSRRMLEDENQRFRKALEFYAEKGNHVWLKANDVLIPSVIHNESGETARKALRGVESE